MNDSKFPGLDPEALGATRDALHSYAKFPGNLLKSLRPKRKHWWHASLRPSLRGLTTGVIHGASNVELELDFVNSQLLVRSEDAVERVLLSGQPASELARSTREQLINYGVNADSIPEAQDSDDPDHKGYSAKQAILLQRAFTSVAGAMSKLRAGIREETSPIQVWPHHFDLSMLWLPGGKIDGKDPADEENADKQMNFGFVFGDDSISEPYFYVTAYPLPDELPKTSLPSGTSWRTDGFNGAVALYKDVAAKDDPESYLLDVWTTLLESGRKSL